MPRKLAAAIIEWIFAVIRAAPGGLTTPAGVVGLALIVPLTFWSASLVVSSTASSEPAATAAGLTADTLLLAAPGDRQEGSHRNKAMQGN